MLYRFILIKYYNGTLQCLNRLPAGNVKWSLRALTF